MTLVGALKHHNIFEPVFNQEENTEDWAYDELVEMEVEATNFEF